MLSLKRILIVLFVCLHWFSGLAQNPYFINFRSENGLPSNAVYEIFEDKKGFIWIASDAGLTRYDGFEFRTYTCDEQTSRPGSNIFEDQLGRIWYQNFDGFLYYIENDKMHLLQNQHPTGYLQAGTIRDRIFKVESHKISIRDVRTLKEIKQIKASDYIASTQFDNTHFYYVDQAICKLDYSGKKTIIHAFNLPYTKFPGLMQKGNREFWMVSRGTQNNKCYELRNRKLTTKFTFVPNAHMQQLSYAKPFFWFCTTQGVFSVHEETLRMSSHYFPKHNISCVFRDKSGNYWFGTQNTGILFVPDLKRKLLFQDINPRKIVIDGNTMFLSTANDKIYRVNLSTLDLQLLYTGESNHMINQLLHDRRNKRLFFSSNSLNCIGENGKSILNIPNVAVKDYQLIDDRYIAIAASGGSGLFELNKTAPSEWKKSYEKNAVFNGYFHFWFQVYALRGKSAAYDPKNNQIYYATNVGLFKVGLQSKKQIRHKKKALFLSRLVRYKSTIYALSTSGKILTINFNDDIKFLTQKLGLENIIIQQMEISDGKLLLASQKHIYVYDLENKFSKITQIPSYNLDVTSIGLWKKQIIIVSENGLLFVPIKTESRKQTSTPFLINTVRINGKVKSYNNRKLFLSNLQNNLEIRYSILDYGQSHGSKLHYRINGGLWENTNSNSRSLKLISLSPGDYDISFRLENNPHLYHVRFSIDKPWYLTLWFLIGLFLVITGSVFLYFRQRIRRLQHRNKLLFEKIELEEHLNRSMLTSIKSQMNPHFFYNALNTIQYFIFTNDRQNASTYLSKFSKLTRMILEMSDKEYVMLREEINALRLYLDIEKVRFDGDFEFSITIDEQTDPDLIRIPSMIIQPYVENAIKHGLLHKKGAKKLQLTICNTPAGLEITIDDNGIGREMANELNKKKNEHHRPFATSANQKRLELLNKGRNTAVGVTYIDKTKDGRSEGTTVIITIPLNT